MNRKEVKHKLKASCRGVLEELLENVGFNKLEKEIFISRYLHEDSEANVLLFCYDKFISPSTYNKAHNNLLDKVLSYFLYKN